MISKCAHLENSKEVYLDYKQYILEKFEDSYMLPLKREIEDFLRINIHFMLIEKIEGQNPFKN
jgi:WASH complex subunit 7